MNGKEKRWVDIGGGVMQNKCKQQEKYHIKWSAVHCVAKRVWLGMVGLE